MSKKYVNLKEFCDKGYLHEVNRRVLHPLGMALSVNYPDAEAKAADTHAFEVTVWDERDDPEGIVMGSIFSQEKIDQVTFEMRERGPARRKKIGTVIQGEEKLVSLGWRIVDDVMYSFIVETPENDGSFTYIATLTRWSEGNQSVFYGASHTIDGALQMAILDIGSREEKK